MDPSERSEILHLRGLCKSFAKAGGPGLAVLDSIDLTLHRGEIVGLLGRSGSGKSTLLRIVAGLIEPTRGEVRYHNAPVTKPPEGIAMVFQTFALFPWLSVLENVEIGLEGRDVPPEVMRERAREAIDLIGLDGFESAFPRELSGGMRQRVGLARALVVDPEVLLMDEPFSELDVLTAETLRAEFLDLWIEGRTSLHAVLLVTHNIEEAVLLCDRVLVLSSAPGRIVAEIVVDLPHPRDRLDSAFRGVVDRLYLLMTARPARQGRPAEAPALGVSERLPLVTTGQMAGLLDVLASAAFDGKADLRHVARSLRVRTSELLPVADAVELLGFAEVVDGRVHLNAAGRLFAEGDAQARKRIFAEHAIHHVPLVSRIRRGLREDPKHRLQREAVLAELASHLPEREAERTLGVAIDWGRYAELYSFDERTGTFALEEATEPPA